MSQLLEDHTHQTAQDAINEGQYSLVVLVGDNRLALDYILVLQSRVCALRGTSHCMWVNNTGKVYRRIKQIKQQTDMINIITKIFQEIPWTPLISSPGYLSAWGN